MADIVAPAFPRGPDTENNFPFSLASSHIGRNEDIQPRVQRPAQGNLCCRHTFTDAARPQEGRGGEHLWGRVICPLLDILINKGLALSHFISIREYTEVKSTSAVFLL